MDGCMFSNERPTRMCWAKNEKWKNTKIEDRIKEMEWLATSNIPLKNTVLASYMRKGNYKHQCKTMAWYLKLLASSTTVSQKSLAKEDYIPHNTYHSLNKAWWFQHPPPKLHDGKRGIASTTMNKHNVVSLPSDKDRKDVSSSDTDRAGDAGGDGRGEARTL